MPIEVRQMVVKSSVVQASRDSTREGEERGRPNDDEFVRDILAECRRMIRAALDDRKER